MTTTAAPRPIDGFVPWPADVADRYRAAGHWTGTTLDGLLHDAVREAPDRTAVIDGDRTWTYRELDDRAGRLAAGLVDRWGLRRGDRVVVQLPNVAEFVVVVFALSRLGAVPVMALPAHRRRDLEHFCRTADATLIVTVDRHAGFDHAGLAAEVRAAVPGVAGVLVVDGPDGVDSLSAGRVPAARVPVSPADVALLQVSGGTTGTPKLIARTHDDYLYSVRESARICGLHADSRMLVAMPVSHNFTMSSPGVLGIVHARGAIVLTTDPTPGAVLPLVARHRVTIVPAVPPLLLGWLNAPDLADHDLSSLEVVQVGGAKLSRHVAERVEPAFGCRLQQVFGMAEGLVNYTRLDDDHDTVVGTQGLRISADDEVLVVDADGAPVRPGEPGELLTRGPYTIRGYFRAPEHDRRAFTPDGYYRTGDLVVERTDGYLTVVGRTKDQINRGGEKVAPEEVENALLAHPDVHDASVVGVPDEVLGERVRAHVVLRRHAGAGGKRVRPVDLRRHLVAGGLADFKVPDTFELVDALPPTGVGKVDRKRLVAACDAGTPDDDRVLDLVGVGFGPANLALAVALREDVADGRPVDAVFFEAQADPSWHAGMLLEDASMQISFLKDLVTMRNPRSPFTFVSFLHEHGRLVDFTNRGVAEPFRVEFSAYLRWVAAHFTDVVRYGSRVERITPVLDPAHGTLDLFEVTVASADGVRTVRTRDVVVAAGLRPRFPAGVVPGARTWHSADHLHRVGGLDDPRRLVVVGSGQSAMEVALDLNDRFPAATVHLVSSQFGVAPSDQGPLVNRIFDPESVDLWFDAPDEVRDRLDLLHRNANNGVASDDVIRAFHDRWYRDRWLGRERLRLHRVSRVESAVESVDGVHVTVRSELDGSVTELVADAVVHGTGYRPFDTGTLLGEHAGLLRRDARGRPVLRRDHTAELTVPGTARLLLVGQGEHQHGLTSSLLSVAAVRAGEIARSLHRRTPGGAARAAVRPERGSHVPV